MTSETTSGAYTGGTGCGSTPKYVFAFSKNGVSMLAEPDGFLADLTRNYESEAKRLVARGPRFSLGEHRAGDP